MQIISGSAKRRRACASCEALLSYLCIQYSRTSVADQPARPASVGTSQQSPRVGRPLAGAVAAKPLLTATLSPFVKAQVVYEEVHAIRPLEGYYHFNFTGDGCNGQCPKSGCYQEDLDCEYCLAAWHSYPPDPSYNYGPITSGGCHGKKVDCPECEGMMGLSRYDH